ncbi:MAG: DUF4145 domain-containing protein [Alphaproteobacteria bacterium]|nr:DUF4145 domain-containing protein [Alphaproteobacteria bacterium]
MSEAIECHAQGCYRAAALMVRRALEELCEDRGAKGATLEARIEALSASIVIPKGLIDGAHELRFLGNDAAHIVAKQYKNIGREETDLAIDVALTLLRATYQTVDLIARLKARKGSNPSPA